MSAAAGLKIEADDLGEAHAAFSARHSEAAQRLSGIHIPAATLGHDRVMESGLVAFAPPRNDDRGCGRSLRLDGKAPDFAHAHSRDSGNPGFLRWVPACAGTSGKVAVPPIVKLAASG
jgi:hypothetical protein